MTSEQLAIGRALLAGRIPDGVSRDRFSEERHRLIWDAMESAQSMGPLDLATVTVRLLDKGQLAEVGNVPYLLWLAEAAPPPERIN